MQEKIMADAILRYGDVGQGLTEERFTSFETLMNRLEEIRVKYTSLLGMPYAVDLIREPTGRLSVGIGDHEWILCFFPAEGSPLYSLGDESAEGRVLFYFGDHTRMSRRYLIPRSDAVDAIKEWFNSGLLSDAVNWTDEVF
jgi:hypothetical protein